MYCMKPEEASPIVYGMNTQGGESVWSIGSGCEYAENPDSNGDTYNSANWKSNLEAAESEIEQDGRDYNKSTGINDYFEKGKYWNGL